MAPSSGLAVSSSGASLVVYSGCSAGLVGSAEVPCWAILGRIVVMG